MTKFNQQYTKPLRKAQWAITKKGPNLSILSGYVSN